MIVKKSLFGSILHRLFTKIEKQKYFKREIRA